MAVLTDMQDIASAGVVAQAGMDEHLTAALNFAKDNTQVVIDGIEAGMISALKGKLMLAESRQLEGAIAHAATLAAKIHIDQTKVCKKNNVDTGSLSSVGGVPLPPQPLGGGR